MNDEKVGYLEAAEDAFASRLTSSDVDFVRTHDLKDWNQEEHGEFVILDKFGNHLSEVSIKRGEVSHNDAINFCGDYFAIADPTVKEFYLVEAYKMRKMFRESELTDLSTENKGLRFTVKNLEALNFKKLDQVVSRNFKFE